MSWIDYLVEPYLNYTSMEILLESIAMLTGILSVYFAKKDNILVFPTGLISTGLYVWICARVLLYADAGINAYYFIMSIYGWNIWSQAEAGRNTKKIESMAYRDKYILLLGSIFSFALIASILFFFTDSDVPFIDALTTTIFFGAMWLMARKKIEHWALWITADAISIPLYIYKGLGITSIQYLVFLGLAIAGLISWRKKMCV